MSPLFRHIAGHLEHYGYEVNVEDNILKVTHPRKPIFWAFTRGAGAHFRCVFPLGEKAIKQPAALLEFVNKTNTENVVSKFYVEGETLCISAWYPNAYDKSAFSEFFEQYTWEIDAPGTRDVESMKKLFWDDPQTPAIPGLDE